MEEQFYLIWPLIAIVLCRWRFAYLMGLMTLLAAASFVIGQISYSHDPGFDYYMLPSRCGELLLGAMAATAVVFGKLGTLSRFSLALSSCGLLMLSASLALLSDSRVFPGLWALPPTLGAALIIIGNGRANGVARLLALPWLRWLGAVSYSAYLWHWPLLAFYRYGYGEPGLAAGIAIFALTMLLAMLTYHYIEQPARHSKLIGWRTGFVSWCAGSVLLAGLATMFVYADHVLPVDHSDYRRSLASLRALDLPTTEFDYVCQRKVLEPTELSNPHCEMGNGSGRASRVLLMGDSNAAHYVGIIGTFAQHAGFRFRNLEVGSCPPLFGDISAFVNAPRIADCTASQKVWRIALQDADVVILGGLWNEYAHNSPSFLPTLLAQVRQYETMGKRVILLGKVPVVTQYDRRCREKALRFPFMDCKASANPVPADVAQVNDTLRRFADTENKVGYFNVDRLLCPDGMCSAYGRKQESLYFDKQHLSMKGSWEVGQRMFAAGGVPPVFRLTELDSGQRGGQP